MVATHVSIDKVDQTTNVLWDMRKHSVKLAQTFRQLPPDYDVSCESWLEKTTYTRKEKDGFLSELEEKGFIEKVDRACKCFIKAETYPEFKHARPIKSRTDRFKAFMGPIFQGINEVLFEKLKFFIKKVPVNERAQVLKDMLEMMAEINCTDFSSFEAHFIDCIIFAIEFPFYMWVTSLLPIANGFREELYTLIEINKCKFIDFIVECMSRASGEMNTSSGNGYTNLVLFTYVSAVKKSEKTVGQFEGDDGITANFPPNTAPTTKDYLSLGWTCKLIKTEKFEEASFCGIVADKTDLINVCDVKAYIADFGWTKQKYLNANDTTIKALIRAKGFSAIYQYPGCPIIDALGHFALRVTDEHHVIKRMNKMQRKGQLADSRFKNAKMNAMFKFFQNKRPERKPTPENTRELVERLFGVNTVEQSAIESYLDGLNHIEPLKLDIEVPECWRYNTEMFVSQEYIHEVASHKQQLMRDLEQILF